MKAEPPRGSVRLDIFMADPVVTLDRLPPR